MLIPTAAGSLGNNKNNAKLRSPTSPTAQLNDVSKAQIGGTEGRASSEAPIDPLSQVGTH
jgi:hypothetical protein